MLGGFFLSCFELCLEVMKCYIYEYINIMCNSIVCLLVIVKAIILLLY